MTREQAAQIIADAFAQHFSGDPPEMLGHAHRIATALDALGLLNLGKLAFHPDFKPPGQEPEDISRTPRFFTRIVGEEAARLVPRDQAEGSTDLPPWHSERKRT